MKSHYSVGSMFAGIGGICLAFRNAGYNYIYAPSGGTLAFLTNGVAAGDANSVLVLKNDNDVRIGSTATTTGYIYLDDSENNVGIGTTTPSQKLEVADDSGHGITFKPDSTDAVINTTGGSNLTITSSGGNVIIKLGT